MQQSLINHNFATYYQHYINLVNDNSNFIDELEKVHQQTNETLDLITEEKAASAYADGKWTIKELLVHLIDTERIFCTRALCFARNDKTNLPGYDHDNYVTHSAANERSLCDIAKEYDLVRASTIALFKSFTKEMLNREGTANNNPLTVLAIGYIIAGHEIHHINVLKEKYLV